MISFLTILSFSSLAVLFYIYIGYFILLGILSFLFPARKVRKEPIQPSVTLIISCYNEEDILPAKLANCFSLDYPSQKLEICVVSDASSDRTDEIATAYADKGVKLIRQEKRLGKTAGLNLAVSMASGEIIVFSDANAMYEPDAISKLVQYFADHTVGYVVGEAKYTDAASTAAARSEDTYWQYEILIKKMESRLHSMVGGDGAIYAIRRELYDELRHSDINDFVNPLQIIAKGFRGIYEPEAVCWEETSGSFSKEFRRKVRIVNRSFSGLLRVPSVLNPFRTGFFSFEVFSHKLLRWFAPYFFILFTFSTTVLGLQHVLPFQHITVFLALFFLFACAGYLLSADPHVWPIFYMPYYFCSVNIAAFIGVNKRLMGYTQVTWNPPRQTGEAGSKIARPIVLLHITMALLLVFFLFAIGRFFHLPLFFTKITFWTSFGIIFYVYFGYPVVLSVWSWCCPKPVDRSELFPDVSLLICAYNEEEVIAEKIQNSLALNYPSSKLHIAIASDGSSDKTAEIASSFSGERVTLFDYKERSGKIGAILKTVPCLSSDIIVFSDANTMYAPDAVRKLVRSFNDAEVGAASADVILQNVETTFGRSESSYYSYERWIQRKESEIGSIIGADGGMYAIRRELFKAPSPNIILDDFVISMNVALQGKRVVFDEDALGFERSTITHKEEFIRRSRVIAGAVQALKQAEGIPGPGQPGLFFSFLSHKLLRWLVPFFLIAMFFSNGILAACSGSFHYELTFGMQILLYFLGVIGFMSGGEGRFRLLGLPFYFCLVNIATFYGLYKGIFNKQAVTWKKFSRKQQKKL